METYQAWGWHTQIWQRLTFLLWDNLLFWQNGIITQILHRLHFLLWDNLLFDRTE